MSWHERQNAQVTESLDALSTVFNHPSAFIRLRGICDQLIVDKHFLNVLSVYRRDDKFRIVDVGCGCGELISRIAEFFPNADCIGIDTNPPSIRIATSHVRPNLRFEEGSFFQASQWGVFDVVICSEVLEHVLEKDTLIDALVAMVRPSGGLLSISTPSGWMYRLPRLYNVYKFLQNPVRFYRLYLRPEQHWAEALAIHPALFPSKLRRILEERGLRLRTRQSSLWWLLQPGVTYYFFSILERLGWSNSGITFHHLVRMLDALMNVVPLFRIFESRCVLLLEKR